MKKLYIILTVAGCFSLGSYAQGAIDAFRLSQPDLRGTARFIGMAGAFGALGGDLSTLSQNPAGIGVYRSNELGFTLDLDMQNAKSTALGSETSTSQTKFYLDNIGGVATLRLGSSKVPNLNFGFTYNKVASFSRRYKGFIPSINTSMTNYISGLANEHKYNVNNFKVIYDNDRVIYDPYIDPYNNKGDYVLWLPILGYDSNLINHNGSDEDTSWTAIMGDRTTGNALFDVIETGGVNEYNIAIGGNIANKVFWGMNFDIVDLDYNITCTYGENLENAIVRNPHDNSDPNNYITNAQWKLRNVYNANGQGFNYQLGVIVKPIQELRFGFAFHTPTFYNITETYSANTTVHYFDDNLNAETNNGYPGSQSYNFNSPWKVIASVAGVIGSKFIISADYEWNGYKTMKYSEPSNNYYYGEDWGWDYGWDFNAKGIKSAAPLTPKSISNDPYYYENQDIKDIYRSTTSLRIGAEYRVTPNFSVRAGYSFVSSPVEARAKNNDMTIYTAGTMPNYRFDNTTNYITAGLGYRTKGFYIDLAYVYKKMDSEYHAFTPDPGNTGGYISPQAKLGLSNNRIVLSAGFKF